MRLACSKKTGLGSSFSFRKRSLRSFILFRRLSKNRFLLRPTGNFRRLRWQAQNILSVDQGYASGRFGLCRLSPSKFQSIFQRSPFSGSLPAHYQRWRIMRTVIDGKKCCIHNGIVTDLSKRVGGRMKLGMDMLLTNSNILWLQGKFVVMG